MKRVFCKKIPAKWIAILGVVAMVLGWAPEAQAQLSTRWLAVGKLHHPYLSGGAEVPAGHPFTTAGLQWPGILPNVGHSRNKGLWISALNWQDEDGQLWAARNSHMGPRVNGTGEVFDVEHEIIARFAPPVVRVDGLETFLRPVNVDEVEATLTADRVIHTVLNSSVGVTVQRRPMQWSQEYHDSYHIIEYTFTNTGNTDDDDEIELPDQNLEDVYFVLLDHPTVNAPAGAGSNSAGGVTWGQYSMIDAVGDGNEDYDVDFRAHYVWMGNIPGKDYSTLGNPMWFNDANNPIADDTLGRLAGAHMLGTVVLHADGEAHEPGVELGDDRAQPRLMTYVEWDWSSITADNDHTNVAQNEFERQWIERGSGDATRGGNIAPEGASPRTYPHQADIVAAPGDAGGTSWSLERFARQSGDPSLGRAGGWGYANGFGPYDMAPGEQVKVVVAEGVAGLSDEAKFAIGRRYKLSGGDDDLEIDFDVNGDGTIDPAAERMTKNEWAMTSRDSLFQLFERARANYQSGYSIPRPPRPPAEFNVVSGTDQIALSWALSEEGPPPGGWQLWRAQKAYYGVITALRVGDNGTAVPDESRAYELIAELEGSTTSYTDTEVERGLSYFYYLQAVGTPNEDPTGLTPTGIALKSSRYYTQTYEPAFLKRPPGASLSAVRIVPNPYNLSADPSVRFGDRDDKLAFYELPGEAEIRIYTELGELVEVLVHDDGSGDEFWDLTTSSRQVVASGLYLAVIKDVATGEQTVQKFIVIR